MRSIVYFLISLIMISFIPIGLHADNGNTLYYYSKTSTVPMTISLEDLDKMTFSESGIQVWSKNKLNEISFDDFMLFTFIEIEHPFISLVETFSFPQDIRIRYIAGHKTLIIESEQTLSGLYVYDLQGRIINSDTKYASFYRVVLPDAPKGVYVIKTILNGKASVNKIIL